MAKIDNLTIGVNFTRCSECEYKNRASIRDDMLVTAGARAAFMYDQDIICLPEGVMGEHQLAELLTRVVDTYLSGDFGNFDNWIETALMQAYGKK